MLKTFRACGPMWKTIQNLILSQNKPKNTDVRFSPDSGRWLWNEEFQRARHTRVFNVRALEDAVATAMGVQPGKGVVCIRKLAEGASNKVFIATTRSNRVVVKLPDPVVPRRLITASEVATLEFLRTELDMPVPRVLGWSSSKDNPVGCEYIIMDEVHGDPLDLVWDTSFKFEEKLGVVNQVHSIQSRSLQKGLQLEGYGSLYFSNNANALEFKNELPVKNKNGGPTRFCLGPLAHRSFMHPEVARAGINCGPWTSPQDYLIAAIDCSIAKVKSQQEGREDPELVDTCFDFPYDTCSDASPEAALRLLHQYRVAAPALLPSLSEDGDLARPVIWHKDLHLGNIFVNSNGLIKGVVDWQDTYCLPLFFQAEIPCFLDFSQGSALFEVPQNFSALPNNDEKKELSRRFLQTKLRQYYLASLSEESSGMSKILENPSWAGLRNLAVSVAGRSFSCQADFILLRELLLKIQRHWAEIVELSGSDATCPVSISDNELANHRADGKQWNEFKDMLKSRNIPTARAGWVHKEDFKTQKEALRLVVKDFLFSLKNKEHREQFKKNIDLWKITVD